MKVYRQSLLSTALDIRRILSAACLVLTALFTGCAPSDESPLAFQPPLPVVEANVDTARLEVGIDINRLDSRVLLRPNGDTIVGFALGVNGDSLTLLWPDPSRTGTYPIDTTPDGAFLRFRRNDGVAFIGISGSLTGLAPADGRLNGAFTGIVQELDPLDSLAPVQLRVDSGRFKELFY